MKGRIKIKDEVQSQKFLDEFDPSTMSMSSLDTEKWEE